MAHIDWFVKAMGVTKSNHVWSIKSALGYFSQFLPTRLNENYEKCPKTLLIHLKRNTAYLVSEIPDNIHPCSGLFHYGDVIMGTMASQITSLTIFYSNVRSGADHRKRQSSTLLAFVLGIHRGPVNSPHKWPLARKMFLFHDAIMCKLIVYQNVSNCTFVITVTSFTEQRAVLSTLPLHVSAPNRLSLPGDFVMWALLEII